MWTLLFISCIDVTPTEDEEVTLQKTDTEEDIEPITGPIEPDALHYDYRFDSSNRSASATVEVFAPDGGDCVTLDYRAGEPEQAWWDDDPVEWELGEDDITVCGTPLAPGDTVEVGVDLTVE